MIGLLSRHRTAFTAAGIVLLGLFLRLIYLNQYLVSPLFFHILGPDTQEYDAWARRILVGQLLWTHVDIHAPLYPYYLALLYWLDNLQVYPVRLFQSAAALAAFLPLFGVLRRYYRRGVWTAAPLLYLLGAAIYTPLIFYTDELLSEALLLPLLCLALACLYRSDRSGRRARLGWLAAAGGLTGLAGICHPLSLAFPAAVGLFLLWRHRRCGSCRWLPALLFGLCCLLPVALVSGYNSGLEGRLVLIQKNGGYNFFLGNNPDATGCCYIWPGPAWDKVHGDADREAAARGISPDAYFLHQAGDFIVNHPLAWTELLAKKALYVWNARELAAGPDLPELRYFTSLMYASKALPGILMTFALGGLVLIFRYRRELWRGRYFLLLLLSGWLALTLTVTGGRYRLFLLPGVFFTGVWLLVYLIERRSWRLAAAVLGLSALAVWLPRPATDEVTEKNQAYTILGEAYLHAGNRETALAYLDAAEQGMSRWARSYNLLGSYYEDIQPELAERYYRKAIACNPGEAYSYMNLGNLYSKRNLTVIADSWFKQALHYGADNPQVLYNVGYFELQRGHRTRARELFKQALERRPNYREVLNALAVLSMLDNQPREALEWLHLALRLAPRNPGLMVNAAAAYASLGDLPQAEKWLQKALDRDPRFPPALALQRQLRGSK